MSQMAKPYVRMDGRVREVQSVRMVGPPLNDSQGQISVLTAATMQ
jgi:hypothetical protein